MSKSRPAPPPGYISVDDAAKLASISRSTAFNYSQPGDVWDTEGVNIYRPTKRGRWINEADLLAWLKKRGRRTTTE
jgi:hypothetical protein